MATAIIPQRCMCTNKVDDSPATRSSNCIKTEERNATTKTDDDKLNEKKIQNGTKRSNKNKTKQ